mmetsp:Transcript_5858/g.7666  ORF Transcript_5858/g.7666 Transcript_5858/m.7666 type:complete len:433 (+) Transcript_5858:188-1486(+)
MKSFLFAASLAVSAFRANAEGRTYQVPSFSVSDLAIHGSATTNELKDALYGNGIVAVTGIENFDSIQSEAVKSYHQCVFANDNIKSYELEDGTKRSSLGVAVQGNNALPFEVSSDCSDFAYASSKLQTSVSSVSDAFLSSLDAVFGNRAAIKRKNAEEYTSISHALMSANHLEHFHEYTASESTSSLESVDWHTDTGLLIAFTPGVFFDDGKVVKADDDLFFVKLSNGETVRPIFPPNSLVFMVGEAMGKLIDSKLAAVSHSLKVNPVHDKRVWYGRMFLPPADAIFAEGMTFGDFRHEIESGSASAHTKSIGCSGANDVVGTVQHRRQLQEPNCTLANETACWMQCRETVDCGSEEELRCMNQEQTVEWVLSSAGADSCVDDVECIVGVHAPNRGLELLCYNANSSPASSLPLGLWTMGALLLCLVSTTLV